VRLAPIIAVITAARAATADVAVVEAPFALGVAGNFGTTPLMFHGRSATARELGMHTTATVGGHLAISYERAPLFVAGGGEWTLLLGEGQMPQAWLTVGAALPTTGAMVFYAGPSLRVYDLYFARTRDDAWSTGSRVALTGELGIRALLFHTHSRHAPTTTGIYIRGNVPIAGGSGWTATICIAGGPPMRLD